MNRKKSLFSLLALLAISGASPQATFGQDGNGPESGNPKRTIEGVWRTAVTFVNCQTGDPFPFIPVLANIFTFHQGGTMSEYGFRPNMATPARGPGHGIWRREGGWQSYSFKIIFNRYNSLGEFVGTQIATGVLELGASGDSFTSRSTIQVLDAAGNQVNSGCTTVVGTRFE